MSENPDHEADANEAKHRRQDDIGSHLAIVRKAILQPVLYFKEQRDREAAEKKRQTTNDDLIAAATHRMARYTLWIALFTFFSIVTAGLTLRVLWDQYAQEQAVQRAYVFVSEARVDNINSGVPFAQILSKNTGQTPAYRVNVLHRFAFGQYPLTEPLEKVGTEPGDEIGEVTLGPGIPTLSVIQSPLNIPLTDDEKAAFAAGTLAFYIYGRITYVDVFGKTTVEPFSFIVGGPDKVRDGKAYSYAAKITPG